MTQLCIIGATASGKSNLALKVAQKIDAYILSLDSLSIYKEIDIVSAKPSKEELNLIQHFGIDAIYPDQYFSVEIFIQLYQETLQKCKQDKKNLVIVGGSSFYLKTLLSGLSQLPPITPEIENSVQKKLKNLHQVHSFLSQHDPLYMQKINKNDHYRIEKALLIYEASNLFATQWFLQNPPTPIIQDVTIFNIDVARTTLRERISLRTNIMLQQGLLDEIAYLEQKYTRLPNAMGAIGIIEVLEYFDTKVTKEQMIQNIITHTAQLAKRQQTFNNTQFPNIISAPLQELEDIIYQKISKVQNV